MVQNSKLTDMEICSGLLFRIACGCFWGVLQGGVQPHAWPAVTGAIVFKRGMSNCEVEVWVVQFISKGC